MTSLQSADGTTQQLSTKRSGPLRKIKDVDVLAAREFINIASLTLEPEDRTQRKAFSALMPDLYMLRNKGFSFQQLASILNSVGFTLQPGTVRNYFNEMLVNREEEFIQRMNEQLVLLEAVKKETQGASMATYSGKVAEILDRQRSNVATKVDAMLGIGEKASTAPSPSAMTKERANSRDTPGIPDLGKSDVALKSATSVAAPNGAASDNGLGFGLAVPESDAEKSVRGNGSPAFFDLDVPVVPDISSSMSMPPVDKQTDNSTPVLKCRPLQTGIAPIPRRSGVPDDIYSDVSLEHPAIPGLLLTRDERLFGAYLEYADEDGVVHMETAHEKRFRIKWEKPIPVTASGSSKDFVKMDMSLFKS